MATVLAQNFGNANSPATHAPKMSTSRRGMDGVLSKRVMLFCNGDKFFKGKKVFIVPSRYHNFSDFLNDLTGKLPSVSSLPYGVRQIFSPTSGRKIRDVEELADGRGYVCAGFEQFRPLNYGEFFNVEPQRPSRAQIAPRPSAKQRIHARNSNDEEGVKVAHVVKEPIAPSMSRDARSPREGKSKLFVVISNAIRPRKIIRIFLSPNTFPSMDRLIFELQHQFSLAISGDNGHDASMVAAAAEFTSGKIRRLYSIHGVEISSPSDFFKVDDHYIALGSEKFTTADLKEIINEIYPNGTAPKNIFKSWEAQRSRKRKPSSDAPNTAANPPQNNKDVNQNTSYSKPTPAVAQNIGTSKKVREDNIDELAGEKMPKTSRSGAEHASSQAAVPTTSVVTAAPTNDSRSRMEGDRMKKDSGFVEEILTKESNSPSHHVHSTAAQSVMLASTDKQPSTSEHNTHLVSPRGNQALEPLGNELPTVFEAKSVDATFQTSALSQQLTPVPATSEKPFVKESQTAEKALKPVQLPANRPKPAPIHADQKLPSQHQPGSVVTSNAPKTTWEVDPELADVLDRQQQPTANVQKYAVLPEIGHSNQGKEEDAEKEKEPVSSETDKATPGKPVLPDVEDESSAPPLSSDPPLPLSSRQTPARPPPSTQPAQSTPVTGTQTPATVSETPRQTPAQVQQADGKGKSTQQGANRPKLEHQPLMIDGRPESRTNSRSSSAAPNSAPGRTVIGKLSRQISKIDHVTSRFEYVGKQLGDGNFAVVRKCKRRKTGAEYAMKIIDKSKLKGKFHMVENEIRIMRACDHQNLVKLYEMYETDKEIFLVMELVPDGDLFDAITAAVKFDEPTASKMVHDMASGLFYLHSRRIVHRDLKPENLLVLRSPQSSHVTLKLGDFGLAMEVTEPIYSVCGTPTYVAPEILAEKGYGLEVDLWALGVISYILMCGFPPFRSQKRRQSELFEQIKSGKFVFLSPYWDAISVLAKELISKLLVVDPRKRYTATDVLCHPWVISQGGSSHPSGDMATHRKNLRKSLEDQSRANWKNWISVRQSKGFNAILAAPGPIRPSSRT